MVMMEWSVFKKCGLGRTLRSGDISKETQMEQHYQWHGILKRDIVSSGTRLPWNGNVLRCWNKSQKFSAWRGRIIRIQISQTTLEQNVCYQCRMGASFSLFIFSVEEILAPYSPLCSLSREPRERKKGFPDVVT